MTTPRTIPTKVILGSGRYLTVRDGDYPEVAKEVYLYVVRRFVDPDDELEEFLLQRDDAAPAMVSSAHILTSTLRHDIQRWRKGWLS